MVLPVGAEGALQVHCKVVRLSDICRLTAGQGHICCGQWHGWGSKRHFVTRIVRVGPNDASVAEATPCNLADGTGWCRILRLWSTGSVWRALVL